MNNVWLEIKWRLFISFTSKWCAPVCNVLLEMKRFLSCFLLFILHSYSFSVKFRIILFSIKSCVLFAIKCNMLIVKYCELCSQSHSIEMRKKKKQRKNLIWIAIRLTIKANRYLRERISENALYHFEFISFFSSLNFSPRFDSFMLQVF